MLFFIFYTLILYKTSYIIIYITVSLSCLYNQTTNYDIITYKRYFFLSPTNVDLICNFVIFLIYLEKWSCCSLC